MNQYFNDRPLVTVLLPISKLDQYFESAIASIVNQTYRNLQILVLANGVSDEAFDSIRSLCSHDERIELTRLELRGLAFALNYGINFARGEFIARMDGDDISLPDRINAQVNFLTENKTYDVAGGQIYLIDEHGCRIAREYNFYESDREIRRVLPYRNPLCHPALMFRRTALLEANGYKFGFMSEDHELFIRMMANGVHFYNIRTPVLEYRRHSEQITDISKAKMHFAEVSGFMIMYFIKTLNPKFLLGAAALVPFIRHLRNTYKRARGH